MFKFLLTQTYASVFRSPLAMEILEKPSASCARNIPDGLTLTTFGSLELYEGETQPPELRSAFHARQFSAELSPGFKKTCRKFAVIATRSRPLSIVMTR